MDTSRVRTAFYKHVIQGKIEGIREVTGRQRRRGKLLLGDVKGKGGYCKLKEEALDRTVWRTGFGKDFGTVVRHTAG